MYLSGSSHSLLLFLPITLNDNDIDVISNNNDHLKYTDMPLFY